MISAPALDSLDIPALAPPVVVFTDFGEDFADVGEGEGKAGFWVLWVCLEEGNAVGGVSLVGKEGLVGNEDPVRDEDAGLG